MTVYRLLPLVSLAGALLALAPSGVRAQSPEDLRARELFMEGDRYYSEGRYELAVAAFQESYRLSGRPLLLFNLANAYERLGRYAEALDALQRYLPASQPREQMALRSRIASLERRVAETPEEPVEPPARDTTFTTVGYIVGGAGVAVTAVGIIMGVLALDARSAAQAGCVTHEGETLCDESVRGALSDDAAFAAVADAGVVVGVAAIAAGVTLVILDATGVLGSDESAGSAVAALPYVSPRVEGAEVGVVVAF